MGEFRSFDHSAGFALTNPDALPAPEALLVVHTDFAFLDGIRAEHTDFQAFATFFRAETKLGCLSYNLRAGIDHFSRYLESTH